MASAPAVAERRGIGDDTNGVAGNNSANVAEPVTMKAASMLQIHEHDIHGPLLNHPRLRMTADVSFSKRVTLPVVIRLLLQTLPLSGHEFRLYGAPYLRCPMLRRLGPN